MIKKILSALMVLASLVSASPCQEAFYIAYVLASYSGQTLRFEVEESGVVQEYLVTKPCEELKKVTILDPKVREYKVSSYDNNDKLTGQSVCTFNESQTELNCESISGDHLLIVEGYDTHWGFFVLAD